MSGSREESAFHEMMHAGAVRVAKVAALRGGQAGRVVFFVAGNLVQAFDWVEKKKALDKSVLSMLFVMKVLVRQEGKFILVHVHDGLPHLDSHYFSWVSKFYKLLPTDYLEKVEKIYVLTSSRRLRSRLWLARSFTSAKLWTKVEYVHSQTKLQELLHLGGANFARMIMCTPLSEGTTFQRGSTQTTNAPVAEQESEKEVNLGSSQQDDGGQSAALWRSFDGGIQQLIFSENVAENAPLERKRTPSPPLYVSHQSHRHLSTAVLAINKEDNHVKGPPRLDKQEDRAVPALLKDCVGFISNTLASIADQDVAFLIEGLFRIPGDETQIELLQAAYSQGDDFVLETPDHPFSINAAASVLKAYFRNMPIHVVHGEMYLRLFELSAQTSDTQTLAYMLGDQLMALPSQPYNTMAYLVHFLAYCAGFSHRTKMDAQNLAVVWTPNLFSRSDPTFSLGLQVALQDLSDLPYMVKVLACMILHSDIVFPSELLSEPFQSPVLDK